MNYLQQHFQKTDIIFQSNNKRQIQKLNRLESQAWMYAGILERLGTDPSVDHVKIAKTLQALESKRNLIYQELEPRKPSGYRTFTKIQNSARDLLASQAEKDFINLQFIVRNTIEYTENHKQSEEIFVDVLKQLSVTTQKYSTKVTPTRLGLAYEIEELISLLSKKILISSSSNSDFYAHIQELNERIQTISKSFRNLLEENQKYKREISEIREDKYMLQQDLTHLRGQKKSQQQSISQLQQDNQELRQKYQEIIQENNQLRSQIFNVERQLLQRNAPQHQSNKASINKKLISDKPKISEDEFKQISNQKDYVYVSGYTKQNGTYVEAYYRRRPTR